jgi:hypothetical protein
MRDNNLAVLNSDPVTVAEQEHLTWLEGVFSRELVLRRYKMRESSIDEAYYDNEQWSEEDKMVLEERGQAPLVFNETRGAVEWILGSAIRGRTDWKVYGRGVEDADHADIKNKLIKYISDINRAGWQRSAAFAECVKSGEGWTEICIEADDFGKNQIVFRQESWRNIMLDSSSKRLDMSDARYVIRSRIVDIDDAVVLWPQHESMLRSLARERTVLELEVRSELEGLGQGSSYENEQGFMSANAAMMIGSRPAIRLIEVWYRKNKRVDVLHSEHAQIDGLTYDPKDEQHGQWLQHGYATKANVRQRQVRLSVFTAGFMLSDEKSPYKHNRFPFVRRTAYINAATGQTYGVIRCVRDIQDDLNKRRSKAQLIFSTRRAMVQDGGVEDMDEFAEQLAKPNGIMLVNDIQKVKIEEQLQLAESQVRMAEQNSAYIRQISGVTGENLGLQTNATSGVAIDARSEQGTIVTTPLMDNNRLAHQLEGELLLSVIEQFMDEPMQFRVLGPTGDPDFIKINDGTAKGDITASQCDFVVDEENYRVSQKSAMAEQFSKIAQVFAQAGQSQVAAAFMVAALNLQDIPNRQRIMQQVYQMTGLPDPNESKEDKAAREQAQAQEAQAQAELANRKAQADVALIESKVADMAATTGLKENQDIQQKLIALKTAMEASGLLLQQPQLGILTDDLLKNITGIIAAEEPAKPVSVNSVQNNPNQATPNLPDSTVGTQPLASPPVNEVQ